MSSEDEEDFDFGAKLGGKEEAKEEQNSGEDSAEDGGNEDSEDEEPSRPKKPVRKKKQKKIGDALSRLLGQELSSDEEAPVLVRASKREREVDPELVRRKKISKRRKEKKMLMAKDRIVPQFTEVERRLIRVATRGVVTLFNAVRKQQKKMEDAEEMKHSSVKVKDVSGDGFVKLLSAGAQKKNLKPLEGDQSSAGDKPLAGDTGPGWKILKDNYLLDAKLKDFDLESDSEEEEEQDRKMTQGRVEEEEDVDDDDSD